MITALHLLSRQPESAVIGDAKSSRPAPQRGIAAAVSTALMLILCTAPLHKPAFGQAFPNKPIRMIVPFPPGGATDRVARTVAAKVSASLGQQVVADNRPGANSRIATEIASKADPDGYTLLVCALTHVTNPGLFKSLPYDTVKDFSSIALLARTPLILAVHPKVPAKSVKDLVALSKSKPQGLNYASAGAGTAAHLGMELLKLATKANATHVSYKGAGPQVIALLSGQVELGFATTSTAKPHVENGRLVAVALAAQKRSKSLPSVPTFAEVGYPGIEIYAWSGLLAPDGTPASVIQRLNQEVNKALRLPEVLSAFEGEGIEATPSTAQATSAYIENEIRKWTKVIRESGISTE